MKTETNECPHCSGLKVSGTFRRHPMDKSTDPYRVVLSGSEEEGSVISVAASSLEMARATACGKDGVKIEEVER